MAALTIALALIAATIAVHYEALRLASVRLVNLPIPCRLRIIVVLVAALVSHMIHVLLYAFTYLFIERHTGLGTIDGLQVHGLTDALYFSLTSYTTLGFGDLYPTGALRLLSGIEALNGLVMVGWTASMTYLSMERFWRIGVTDNRPSIAE